MIVPTEKSAKFQKQGGLASEDILSKKGMSLNAFALRVLAEPLCAIS